MFDTIKQPLPFYDSLDKQQVNESGFVSTQNIFLYSPNDKLIPFQIYRTSTTTSLIIYLVKKVFNTTIATNITANITIDRRIIVLGGIEYDYFRYFGNSTLAADLGEGYYYIHITDGTLHWYSEWFTILEEYSDNLIKLEYWNTRDMYSDAYYLFQNDFKFRIWIPGFIKLNSEYEIFEKIVTKFNNEQIKPYQKKAKLYSLVSPVNAFMGDVLNISEMCDNVWLTTQNLETKKITIIDLKLDEVSESDIMELTMKFKAGFIERGNLDQNAALKQVILIDETDAGLSDENDIILID